MTYMYVHIYVYRNMYIYIYIIGKYSCGKQDFSRTSSEEAPIE